MTATRAEVAVEALIADIETLVRCEPPSSDHEAAARSADVVAARGSPNTPPPTHTSLGTSNRMERLIGRRQWESPGTFLGLPATSTGTNVKQPKGHLRRSAARGRPAWLVMGLAGLFFDI
ncbi:hypothetical protein [Streptomyces celluloflavus]|uniref:hypothetical protein n=1 Tax=Streptomyces celluloflavus TaxID=58344 RepID=UPI003461599D|nr:hypothetical protein OG717_09525 [Streptomyces celluloflavus]